MQELPFINNPVVLQKELKKIRTERKATKVKRQRNYILSKPDRALIHAKTDGKCHICGLELEVNKYEADHIKSHSKVGTDTIENFLPACKTCNNYRWDYLPAEMQWILKLGVWARTEIENNTSIGLLIAKDFTSHENRREKRRSKPRIAKEIILS